MKKVIMIVAVVSLGSSLSFARGGGKGHELRKAACESKSAGEVCSFEGRKGTVEGLCSEGRRDASVLVCKDPNKKGKREKREEE